MIFALHIIFLYLLLLFLITINRKIPLSKSDREVIINNTILKQSYSVYILYCNNGSYYTGYTSDLSRRFQQHIDGTAKCKYTQSFKPLYIAQSWVARDDKSLAMKVEAYIKKLTRKEKEELISHPETLTLIFPIELETIDV